MTPDFTNGLFEAVAALFISLHVRAIYKDKEVKGVSPTATAFFFTWGVWNVFFYPSQKLMWSFYGGLLVVTANIIYLWAMFYYIRIYPKRMQKARSPVRNYSSTF